MDEYFNNSGVIAEIEKCTISDDEFTTFARALELNSSDIFRLKKDGNRVYLALRKWLNQKIRTRAQFKDVLDRWGNFSLALKLGFTSESTCPVSQTPKCEVGSPSGSAPTVSLNPFAAALAKKSQIVTIEAFLAENNNWLSRICVASNARGSWEQLLGELGLLSTPEIEKIVRIYHQEWKESQSNNPTLLVLVQLCKDRQFAAQSIDELSALLKKLENPELLAVVQEWDSFRGLKTAEEISKNATLFDGARELKAWLIANQISEHGDVEDDVAQLRSREFGVKRLSDLLRLRPGSFDRHFSIVKAQAFDSAIGKQTVK